MTLQLGSHGDSVRTLQQKLQDLGILSGGVDGIFGGGTQAAVKTFQQRNGLDIDGIVGPLTWNALFPGTPTPPNEMLSLPVAQRCLALTGAFETGAGVPDCYCGLAGDFDGQGISYGVLQWNIGQGSLQPLLCQMLDANPTIMADLFHDNLSPLRAMLAAGRNDQLAWARSIQDPVRHRVFEPWNGLFSALGRTPEFQAIQLANASARYRAALAMCADYGLTTERAAALMFDICTQNGSIADDTRRLIMQDFAALPPLAPPDAEVARMRIVANRRAEAARAAYVEDVRCRKLAIAEGSGTVHNIPYDLEEQFGIRLVSV